LHSESNKIYSPIFAAFLATKQQKQNRKKENMPTQDGRKEKVAGMNSCGPNEATNTLNDH